MREAPDVGAHCILNLGFRRLRRALVVPNQEAHGLYSVRWQGQSRSELASIDMIALGAQRVVGVLEADRLPAPAVARRAAAAVVVWAQLHQQPSPRAP